MNTQEESIGELIPEALLIELKRRYPNQVPNMNASDRDIWAAVGEQQVIGFLQREHDSAFKRDDNIQREDF